MDYDAFINRWLGKAIDWDGEYGAQCVDLVAQYCADNGKPVAYANAKDWANNPALQGAFDWIANDPNDPNQLPQRGDIVVFSGNSPGSGGMGHINIFDMSTGANTWQGLDQNWNGAYVHFVPNHVWTYVLGWWHVKPSPTPEAPPPPPPAPTPIPAPDPHPDPAPEPPAPESGTPPVQTPVPNPTSPEVPVPPVVIPPVTSPDPTPPQPLTLEHLIAAVVGAVVALLGVLVHLWTR